MLVLQILCIIQLLCILTLVLSFRATQITGKHVSTAGTIFFLAGSISTFVFFFKFVL